MILADSEFNIKDIVYLKTDADQLKRIVTGVLIREHGVSYELTCGASSTWHYDFEMSATKDVMITTSN